jgi:hypothetical protein
VDCGLISVEAKNVNKTLSQKVKLDMAAHAYIPATQELEMEKSWSVQRCETLLENLVALF